MSASETEMDKIAESMRCSELVATECSRELFSSYPDCAFSNPDVFVRGVISMLMRYPESIVRKVCGVETGIPTTCKILPSIAHIREACEMETIAF